MGRVAHLNVEVVIRSDYDFGYEVKDFDLSFLILEKLIQHLHSIFMLSKIASKVLA